MCNKAYNVTFYRLCKEAQIPTRATWGSYGYDLLAIKEQYIAPQNTGVVPTGLMVKLSKDIELQIRSRSGLAANKNVFVLNSPATIDFDFFSEAPEEMYKFELKVIIHNLDRYSNFVIQPGDRVAQAVPCYLPVVGIYDENGKNYNQPRCINNRIGGIGSTGR